jgi:oligoendopeptidase F
VRDAFASYSGRSRRSSTVRSTNAGSTPALAPASVGGAFCMSFVDDRSLVLPELERLRRLGADHRPRARPRLPQHPTRPSHTVAAALPMALAETASIFCETLVVEAGLQHLQGADRLALLDVDLQHAVQVVVDIRSRVLFETEVFARRQRRTLGIGELHELMLRGAGDAYGDGLDQSTAHPYMWALKPHYYSSHFYNWPYTYGLLFGLGLFAQYQRRPRQRFSRPLRRRCCRERA